MRDLLTEVGYPFNGHNETLLRLLAMFVLELRETNKWLANIWRAA